MIIEFFGPSGSGKTTIAKLLSKDTGWEYIKIDSRREKLKYVIIFLFRAPLQFLLLFVKTLHQGRHLYSLGRHKIHLFSEFVSRNEKAKVKSKDKNVILDEGLLQYGLSLYERPVSESEALKYVNKFASSPDILQVSVSCSDEERERRMEERKRFPRTHLGIKNKAWQKVISENTKIFIEILTRQNALLFDSSKGGNQSIVDEITQKIK